LGYSVLSVSGGEPFAYRPLPTVLRAAKDNGLRCIATTNGLLFEMHRLSSMRGILDFVAISIDGRPDDHDRMRGRSGVFDEVRRKLDIVRSSGISFGILFTLTMHNVDDLEWAAQFAVEQGAAMLQIHPLEPVGRGRTLGRSVPDEVEAAYAVIEVKRLARMYPQLNFQVDIATRAALQANARLSTIDEAASPKTPLAELVSPLVVEPDGTCVPLEYGFPRAYALGNVNEIALSRMAAWWREGVYESFRRLCREAYLALSSAEARIATNWYEAVSTRAETESEQIGAGMDTYRA
jgi:MoaA/NifB/PqqE/SkfB family radical SAM enzyme